MAFIPDPNNVSIDYGTYVIHVPKSVTTLIQSSPTEIRELDLNWFRLELKAIEDKTFGIAELRTNKHNTTVRISGVDLARVMEIINGYTVTFEDGQWAVQLVGANSNVGDVVNVNQVSIRTANSVGLVTSTAIEYGEYQGKVTVKPSSDYAGTIYPIGTHRRPVNNITDALLIAKQYGFPEIHLLEDLEFQYDRDGLPVDISNYLISGVGFIKTHIIIHPEAICAGTSFYYVDMSGTLDGDSDVHECSLHDINYFNGHIFQCTLSGTITLSGNKDANMDTCTAIDLANPLVVDCGGSGQNLGMPHFSGRMVVTNLTAFATVGIGFDAGEVVIDETCTAGIIAPAGSGRAIDHSGHGCYVMDTTASGTEIHNIQRLIENLRPHHTGNGNIWFFDPYFGNDGFDGDHPKRAIKTFQHLHDNYVVDNNHDIIMCVNANPNGPSITNQEILISKNYVFLRGAGRDFTIHGIDDLKPAIDITGNGVEVAGMIIKTDVTNTVAAIRSSGSFPLLKNLYIEDGNNGIIVDAGDDCTIEECNISHNSGFGVKITGDSHHVKINNTQIMSNLGDGVLLDNADGHAVTMDKSLIHGNKGYGVNVISGFSFLITETSTIFRNTLGDYYDPTNIIVDLRFGMQTHDLLHDMDVIVTDTNTKVDTVITNQGTQQLALDEMPYNVWNFDGVLTLNADSMGAVLADLEYLEHFVFVDSNFPQNGDGTQHKPFDNITDGIDFAESRNIRRMFIYSDIIIDRSLKNFNIIGIGLPKVEFQNTPDLKGTTFKHCRIVGNYTDSISAQYCKLLDTAMLNGRYMTCGFDGDLVCSAGAEVITIDCASVITTGDSPSISLGAGTTSSVHVKSHRGPLIISNSDTAFDVCEIGVIEGTLLFDSSNTDGTMTANGQCQFTNNANGAHVIDNVTKPSDVRDIPSQVWNTDKDSAFNTNSIGEYIVKKILTIKTYLGLQ